MIRPYYEVDESRISSNCSNVFSAFRDISFRPAYSVKTNHIPHIVRKFHESEFLVEVVSDIEVGIAEFAGIPLSDVIYNGPMKGSRAKDVAAAGGIIVFDSSDDFFSFGFPCRCMFRVAININNGIDTRFGLPNHILRDLVSIATNYGYSVIGLHCHVTKGRTLIAWKQKLIGMLEAYEEVKDLIPGCIIDMGGNMYSNVPCEMRDCFDNVATIDEYADLFRSFAPRFGNVTFTLEMGTSVVSDCLSYTAEVVSVKTTSDNTFILLNTSHYSMGWASQYINNPITIKRGLHANTTTYNINDGKFVGLLCTEDDVMYRGFCGEISVGDQVTFHNVGSYSIGTKPPFILAQDDVFWHGEDGSVSLVKAADTVSSVLCTYLPILTN